MLLLTATTDKLQLVTASAVALDVHVSWMDMSQADPPVVKGTTSGRANFNVTTAATTDIVAAPASSTTRNVKALHVQNIHASSSNLVTIQFSQNGTLFILESFTLLAGERISYVEGQGFTYFDATGIPKSNVPLAVGQYTVQKLAATVSNSTTTAAKITGLDLICGVGTWIFEYFLRFQSATATVGPKLSVNHTGTVTSFMALEQFLTQGTLDSTGVMDQDVTAAPTIMAGMAQRAKSNAATMIAIAGVDTTAADVLILVSGLLVCTVAGNIELWHASETATATSIMADSALRLTKVG